MQIATGAKVVSLRKHEKNPAAVALGRLGGLKGGNVRAARLTPEQRQKIASDAARKRWAKERGES
jgi:hypothetical protein